MIEGGVTLAKRNIGSEYINNFNPVFLHLVRSNHDVRFFISSSHKIYYVSKYVVNNQIAVDNIAALTLSKRGAKELRNARGETNIDVDDTVSKSDDAHCLQNHDKKL